MNLRTAFFMSLIGVGLCAAADNNKPQVIACNMSAISAAQRPRYNALMKRLRTAVRSRHEVPDGYSFTLDPKGIALPELAEWITLERLCCSFLTFQLEVKNDGATELSMRGPAGTKAVLAEDFPEGK